jgi:hypothetical protein
MRLLAALLGLLLLAAPAVAQEAGELTGLQITPARTEVDLDARTFAVDVIVVNNEAAPLDVSIAARGLAHDLDGSPILDEDPVMAAASGVEPVEVTLAGGAQHVIEVRGTIPDGRAGFYGSIVAQHVRPGPAQVDTEIRVASIFLLRGPRPWVETTAVAAAGILTEADGVTDRIYADVENTGDVHLRPAGTVEVRQAGRALGTVTLAAEVILPGSARRLVGDWAGAADMDPALPLELVVAVDGGPPTTLTVDPAEPATSAAAGADAAAMAPTAAADPGTAAGPGAGDRGAAERWLPLFALLLLILTLLAALVALRSARRGRGAAGEPAPATTHAQDDAGDVLVLS